MSIEVRIPKEITEYKEKIIFGLSIRQLLCFSVAIISGLGTYFIASKYMGTDIASYIVILEVMPVFAIGFIRINGFTFEKYAAMMIKHRFGINRRPYKTNLLIDEIITEKVKEKTNRRGEKNVSDISKKDKASNKNVRECKFLEITAKSRKRKSKEALRKIKAARQEYRSKKQADKKAAKKGSSTENSTADNKV
ncbi:MAG: PrgI family protein [Oscillospiraceae bacterium]